MHLCICIGDLCKLDRARSASYNEIAIHSRVLPYKCSVGQFLKIPDHLPGDHNLQVTFQLLQLLRKLA